MNMEIKKVAEEAAHLAKMAADAAKDDTMRELALAVFGLSTAVQRLADLAPDGPPATKGKQSPPGPQPELKPNAE
jgi:hypothetical protein